MGKVDISDGDGLVRETEENPWEMWSIFGRGPERSLHEKDDLLWFETPIPIVPYSGVLRSQLRADVDQRIASIVEHFARKKAQFIGPGGVGTCPTNTRRCTVCNIRCVVCPWRGQEYV